MQSSAAVTLIIIVISSFRIIIIIIITIFLLSRLIRVGSSRLGESGLHRISLKTFATSRNQITGVREEEEEETFVSQES